MNSASPASDLSTATSGELARSADSLPGDHDAANNFIDSIGVNTKINTGSGVYANYGAVKSALLGLGVRHIRDAFSTQNLNGYENHLADLANSGIHSLLGLTISPDSNNNAVINVSGTAAAAYLNAGHYARSIEAVGGLNEPDVNQGNPSGPSPRGWASVTQVAQRELFNGIASLASGKRIPVYGPSVAPPHLADVGNISAYMNYGDVHDYSGGYDLPGWKIAQTLTLEQTMSGSRPMVATENGYSTGTTGQGIPDRVMLDYAQRLFFKQFTNNIHRTYWYELLDETSSPNVYWKNCGLLRTSYAPKLAYTGLKAMITLLKDQTPYRARTALNFTFGGQIQFENIEHLLLQKNDGSFWLAVWRDDSEWSPANNGSPGSYPVPATATVVNSLNLLGSYASSITQYTENDAGGMTQSAIPVTAGSTAQISIGTRPRIYRIVPGLAPKLANAPWISSPAAHWALDEAAGSTAADSVNAAGTMAIPNTGKAAWVTGEYRAGLSFFGTQASTNATFINTAKSFSATAWLQMNGLSGYQSAVAVNGRNQSAFSIGYTPQSHLSFSTFSQDSNSTSVSRLGSSFVPAIGRWYAVAATYNGSSRRMSLYVNGVLQSTGISNGAFNGTGGTEIGSLLQAGVGHYEWWNGSVDEVNLYGRELSAGEVRTMAGL